MFVLLRRSSFASFSKVSKRLASSVTSAHEVLKENGEVGQLTQLKNGFNVASYNNGTQTATVGVWIESGSVFEHSDNNGVSTLFEHLLYTGTSSRTATQLQAELAKVGARLKSHTSRDHTAYYAECFVGDIDKVVAIVADIMRNTQIDANKMEEQRAVVLQKLEESDEDYNATIMDNLHKTAFQGTPYSLSPLGSTQSLQRLTKEDIVKFVDDTYKPARMVLTGVGGVDHQQLSDLAEKYFGDLDNNYKQKIPVKNTGVRFTGSEFLYRDDNYPLMYGAIAVEGVPCGHFDALSLLVASTAVGQWDHSQAANLNAPSKLIQKICQHHDIQLFQNFSINHNSAGLFGFYFVAKGDDDYDLLLAVRKIQREWKHLSYGVADDEVDRAKSTLKTNLFSALENNSRLADHFSREVLSCGTLTPLHKLERKIHYISASTVRDAVSRYVYDRDTANVGIGRTEAFPQYMIFRYGMSWWRL